MESSEPTLSDIQIEVKEGKTLSLNREQFRQMLVLIGYKCKRDSQDLPLPSLVSLLFQSLSHNPHINLQKFLDMLFTNKFYKESIKMVVGFIHHGRSLCILL